MNAIAHANDEVDPLDQRRIAELKRLRNGSLLAQLIAGFSEQGEREVAALRAASEARRFQEGAMLAHSLKSSSMNIGAQLVGIICRRIEGDMLSERAEDLAMLCGELETSFRETMAALHAQA